MTAIWAGTWAGTWADSTGVTMYEAGNQPPAGWDAVRPKNQPPAGVSWGGVSDVLKDLSFRAVNGPGA